MRVCADTLRGMYSTPPGTMTAEVTCRGCGRRVQMNPERIPVNSHNRLRCVKCGHRGADISLHLDVRKAPDNVVPLRPGSGRASKPGGD
jgi:hypothetical protein